MQREKDKLDGEREMFFMMNPSTDALEAKLKASDAEKESLRAEMSKVKEEMQTDKEYALYSQRRDYEQKVEDLRAKVTKLGNAFKKLPPPSVFEPAPVPAMAAPVQQAALGSNPYPAAANNDPMTFLAQKMGYNLAEAKAQAQGQETTYIQLLSDLNSLRSKVASPVSRGFVAEIHCSTAVSRVQKNVL